ncbi:MAG TPA: ATP-binding cassette domain-containing protein [Opitutales bacterium]|nr:ATP-binding cassette domain-containing protein [Opitutales bacterium]
MSESDLPSQISVRNLTMAYGGYVVMRDLTFDIQRGEIFVIMGGSGSGKSTLLHHLVGLLQPAAGEVFYNGANFTTADEESRNHTLRRFGIMFQGGALWSSMTLAENVAFPLEEFTNLTKKAIRETVELKLALVGLRGFEELYPAEISGGMCKRASLARAMALDPEILFFDEPSAGLDPVSAQRLDELILELRETLGTTVVVVTHELASIFAIADRAIFLDVATRTAGGLGNPKLLRTQGANENLRLFLNRGQTGVHHITDPATGAPFVFGAGKPQM